MSEGTCTERWLPIVGYEGRYEVSDLGRVRSLDRQIPTRNGQTKRHRGRVLKIAVVPGSPYPFVGLHKDGCQTVKAIHVLVSRAFLGEPPKGHHVLHGPGGRLDNRVCNLSYGTPSQNAYDKRRDGTDWEVNKDTCPLGHPLRAPNLVACEARKGRRYCLACCRGRGRVNYYRRRYGIEMDAQAVTDAYLREILAEAAP